jgi:CRISPR-associated protein Csd1
MNWYKTTSWRFYSRDKSPSLYEIVNFIYGLENKNGLLACENKKLFRSTVERLIPCIIDGHKIPRDIVKTTFYKLSNKQSYKKSWNNALNIGCALIKKQRSDYNNYLIDVNNSTFPPQLW